MYVRGPYKGAWLARAVCLPGIHNLSTVHAFLPFAATERLAPRCAGPGTANASSRTPCRWASATPWWPWAALHAGLLAMGSWYPRPRDWEL